MQRREYKSGHSNFGVGQVLSSLQRGINAYRKNVFVVRTKFSLSILLFLYKRGLIEGFQVYDVSRFLVFLRFWRGISIVKNFIIISKPSKRIFYNSWQIRRRFLKRKIVVVSTNLGLMSSIECLNLKIGGEILFEIVV